MSQVIEDVEKLERMFHEQAARASGLQEALEEMQREAKKAQDGQAAAEERAADRDLLAAEVKNLSEAVAACESEKAALGRKLAKQAKKIEAAEKIAEAISFLHAG